MLSEAWNINIGGVLGGDIVYIAKLNPVFPGKMGGGGRRKSFKIYYRG